MKKKLLSLIVLSLASTMCFAQGINFVESYDKALKLAKKYDRKIFLDVYTQWCGPCKAMEKNIFPLQEVGDFFNRNYLSVKIDAGTEEGKKIAEKFGVNSYPTSVFLDKNGKFIHKISGGLQAKKLILEAKKSMSPKAMELRKKMDKYVAGKMNNEEIPSYLKLLKEVDLDCSTVLDDYLSTFKKRRLYTDDVYKLIVTYSRGTSSPSFKFLVDNYKKFSKVVDKKNFDRQIYSRYVFQTYENNRANKSSASMYAYLKKSGIKFYGAIRENYDLVMMLKDRSKDEEFVRRAVKLLSDYPMAASALLNEAVKQANSSKIIEKFSEDAIERFAKYNSDGAARSASSMAYLYLLNARNYKSALKMYLVANKYSSKKDFCKGSIEYCQRTLGLIKCKNYGQKAPVFELLSIDGKKVSLNDLLGKYVILDFWASWCGPCIGEIPNLKNVYKEYKDRGLEIVSISCDKNDKNWKDAVSKEGLTWVQLTSKGTDIFKKYGVRGIPRIMLLDKSGKIIADELRGAAIEREVNKVISE